MNHRHCPVSPVVKNKVVEHHLLVLAGISSFQIVPMLYIPYPANTPAWISYGEN